LAYVVIVGWGIEMLNSEWRNMLPGYHAEQVGMNSGYYKIRGPGREFQNIMGLLGVWVYPFSVIGAVLFIKQTAHSKSKMSKVILFCCAIVCLIVLARFFWLGVFAAGTGFAIA
jgi:hypothetical protein